MMHVLRSSGFTYRNRHVCLFETPDGWHFQVGYVTQGEYPTRRAAMAASKEFVTAMRFPSLQPSVAERGVW